MRLLAALLLVEAGLVAQAWVVDYGTGIPEQGRWAWLAVGTLLAVAVGAGRVRVARTLLILGGFTGTILYAVNLAEGFPNAGWFVAAYAAQAVPLLTPPVRAHLWPRAGVSGAAPTHS